MEAVKQGSATVGLKSNTHAVLGIILYLLNPIFWYPAAMQPGPFCSAQYYLNANLWTFFCYALYDHLNHQL